MFIRRRLNSWAYVLRNAQFFLNNRPVKFPTVTRDEISCRAAVKITKYSHQTPTLHLHALPRAATNSNHFKGYILYAIHIATHMLYAFVCRRMKEGETILSSGYIFRWQNIKANGSRDSELEVTSTKHKQKIHNARAGLEHCSQIEWIL